MDHFCAVCALMRPARFTFMPLEQASAFVIHGSPKHQLQA
jgi:hypothetical protein